MRFIVGKWYETERSDSPLNYVFCVLEIGDGPWIRVRITSYVGGVTDSEDLDNLDFSEEWINTDHFVNCAETEEPW